MLCSLHFLPLLLSRSARLSDGKGITDNTFILTGLAAVACRALFGAQAKRGHTHLAQVLKFVSK
jgi:hypothetical protein